MHKCARMNNSEDIFLTPFNQKAASRNSDSRFFLMFWVFEEPKKDTGLHFQRRSKQNMPRTSVSSDVYGTFLVSICIQILFNELPGAVFL